MDPLRWRFKIRVDVKETEYLARSKGLSAYEYEGQSRTNEEPYPLNQIEIKGWDFNSNVKVTVSPTVTQIYFYIENMPEIEELENIVTNLGKVEQILNEVVVFAPDESTRFSMETEIPVMSISMLKTQCMLKEELNGIFERLYELVLREISHAHIFLAQGKMGYARKRLDVFLSELVNFQRGLIQMAKEQGLEEAEKWEEELNKSISTSKLLETELALAKSPAEIKRIMERYLRSLLPR